MKPNESEKLQPDTPPEDVKWEYLPGRKARIYKNTTRPPGVFPEVWQAYSHKERQRISEEWKREVDKSADKSTSAAIAIPVITNALPVEITGKERWILEGCCSEQSLIGNMAKPECKVVRITEKEDLTTDFAENMAMKAVKEGAERLLFWVSIPCTGGSPWQNINAQRKSGLKRLKKHFALFKRLWKRVARIARSVRDHGGKVAIEWPRGCSYWRMRCVRKLISELQLQPAKVDGCAVGLKDPDGVPMYKPWTVATDDAFIFKALNSKRCPGHPKHRKVEGSLTKLTENYTPEMVRIVHDAWEKSVSESEKSGGVRNEPQISAPAHNLDGPTEGSDSFASRLNDVIPKMPTQKEDYDHRVREDINSWALVARPVNKSEIASEPKAKKAMDSEWERLRSRGTWDESKVKEWREVSAKAKSENRKIHVGRIFGICVEKGSELQKNDPARKFKGRFVFEGCNVRDEYGQAAQFGELSSSPATLEAAKLVDAFGLLRGNATEQLDAEQAYVQALLLGILTWVRLPRERWPAHWSGMTDPVVPLVLALYGHLDSGGYWERHCEKELRAVGFKPVPQWKSIFFHPGLQLLLMVYVDDFKMSGPSENLSKGWSLIRGRIKTDDPAPVNRCLGCEHRVNVVKRGGHTYREIEYDMQDFMSDCVKQYVTLSGVDEKTLRPVSTPFLEDSPPNVPKGQKHQIIANCSKDTSDGDAKDKGVLQPIACRVLMKILYGARLARFDLPKAVGMLASKITRWDRDCDRQLHRLVSYIKCTTHYRLTGFCGNTESRDDLKIELFADADFAGCPDTVRSTTGAFLALTGPNTFIPISAVSKRQTCVSHSTTEAEVVAADTAIRTEGLPVKHLCEFILNREVDLVLREDNQATMCVMKNGYSTALRHLPRTHRVCLAWIGEVVQDGDITIEYCSTDSQAADIFTKAFSSKPKWQNALQLIGIGPKISSAVKPLSPSL